MYVSIDILYFVFSVLIYQIIIHVQYIMYRHTIAGTFIVDNQIRIQFCTLFGGALSISC